MTVSNVFNNKGKFSEETRARVAEAITALGYVPNAAARRLVGASPAKIGFIFAAVDSMFISAMLTAVAIACAQKGIQLLASSAPSFDVALPTAESLLDAGADALLLHPPFDSVLSGTEGFRALGMPAVSVASAAPLPDMSTVRIDNRAASEEIVMKLAAKGRRRIATISGPLRHSDSGERLAGVYDAMAKLGLPMEKKLVVEGGFTFESGLIAAEQLLSLPEPPDAIVAANDDMAAAAIWVAHRRGLSVPDDVAITGFDDTLLATRVWPTLTTVRQPINQMIGRAVDLLVAAVGAEHEPQDILLPHEYVERGSA